MVMSQINIDLLILFLALTTIDAQNECLGGSANCINIRNCPQIMSILTDRTPPSEQMLQSLRNAQCGFESNDLKYCCNQVTTATTATVKPEIEILPNVTNHPNLRLLDHRACGPVPQHRAVGGNETEIFQYPWMAIIVLYEINTTGIWYEYSGKPSEIFCTGTIISSRYVLTAAQCCYVQGYRVIRIRVGDHDRIKERDCIMDNEELVCAEKYQDYGADSIHVHPGYTTNKLQDDIALIRLNDSIDFRPRNVKPICLPFGTAAIITRKRAIATGWRRGHEKLQQAKLSLVNNEQCKLMYKDLPDGVYVRDIKIYDYIIPDITHKVLCAGQGNEDVCMCEIGAPLQVTGIYNGGSVRIIQHGVSNFVQNCLRREHSAVYTRVSYYMDWILNTMTD